MTSGIKLGSGISSKSIPLILCPPNVATGGPEALHQLCHALRCMNIEASLVHTNGADFTISEETHEITFPQYANPTPAEYEIYHCSYKHIVPDDEKYIVIIPEIWPHLIQFFKRCRIAIWWLSLDWGINALQSLGGFQFMLKYNPINLCQSRYAELTLLPYFENTFMLSDYTKPEIVSIRADLEAKEPIITFNDKSSEFCNIIANRLPQYTFKLLKGMTAREVRDWMLRSQLFLDFGPHPGKDRMPREAAALGNCIITGRRGAAGVFDDVPIPARYKFTRPEYEIDEIIELIDDVMRNFTGHHAKFGLLRKAIKQEEKIFSLEVEQLIGTVF